jgi:hypothetical protein
VTVPGSSVESYVVVLDSEVVSSDDLAYLHKQRWHVELHLREIKSTMELDVLRALTPEMARQELWTGVLKYNLIRHSMLQSAIEKRKHPFQLSFAATSQMLSSSWLLASLPPQTTLCLEALIALRILSGGSHCVGNRPDRVEPRAIKRRPSSHDLLTVPRKEAIAMLLAGSTA